MAFSVDENGNITLVQGDSGELIVIGLPTDRNYKAYFAIQDENRRPIGSELSIDTNKQESIAFLIPSVLTDLLSVPVDEDTATYYYGIKICFNETLLEDTLLIGEQSLGGKNAIVVYPKKVEGD